MITGPEVFDLLAAVEYRLAELGKLRATMVDDGHVHDAEHAIRHRARPRNLQKMAPLMLGHRIPPWIAPNIAFNLCSLN
jgi:hypothetical protein